MKKMLLGACLLLFVSQRLHAQFSLPPPAGQNELADEFGVKYDYMHKLVLNSFFRFKLSDGCWAKMREEDATPNGIQKVNFSINQVAEYLKRQDLGDLQSLNSTNRLEELANRPRMQRIVEAAKPKFSLTLDATAYRDCSNAENWRMLLSYMTSLTQFLGFESPVWSPRGGRADITLVVLPTAKKLTVAISPDATKFMITAPLEEIAEWDRTMENGLRKGGK